MWASIHGLIALSILIYGLSGCMTTSNSRQPAPDPRPSICGRLSSEPPATPFVFNMDAKRRDELVGIDVNWGEDDLGGIAYFEHLPLSIVAQLYEEQFIDPNERQNLAPSVHEILHFMCQYPETLVSGYVVSPKREDYRVTIDMVFIPRRAVNTETRRAFEKLCMRANERSTDGDLSCWWD